MKVVWSQVGIERADGDSRHWAAFACPACGGITTMEFLFSGQQYETPGSAIQYSQEVVIVREFPEGQDGAYVVRHLPENIASYLSSSVRVLQAGVPDAAAVQLRRTLEAAAAAKGVADPKKPLVHSIQKLIENGHVTRDFAEALGHVRKVGNQGAHYTDEQLNSSDVERALLFTVQFLRNLFEVPGELQALSDGAGHGDGSPQGS